MNFIILVILCSMYVISVFSSVCENISPNCYSIRKHCKSPTYIKIMRKNCAKACGFCTPPIKSTSPLMRDRIHNCQAIIDKCNVELFMAYMEKNCKRTCSTVTIKKSTTETYPETTLEELESSGEIIDNDE
uniref:ShKT domain-containing protein n=1 Tax=Parastrongyloides trichosuri TaxID=131310 RepID=A0A0N4ZRN6_PARTI